MDEFTDKVSAAANKAVGTVKGEIGKVTGNEKRRAMPRSSKAPART